LKATFFFSLFSPYYWSGCTKPGKWAAMYLC